ncbi:group II intron maturase-specific domain-containing protein [Clostridium guangxiense]|uniref:group II intron maturase-specific domain-containing protein n=1 Tax=Clostridium guangxiense TaxID=1662055 RepID=UPI001E4AB952|nr:group II intron maturase-specific domain-containing protein [Clostridium guangxiense]MCD2347802.1 hypothetical protein [Clostridium guangxiense]
MKDTKEYEESRQLHKEGYLQENRVELKDNVEVQSISSMSEEGRNNVYKYGNDLLSKILSRDNLNRAFLRVKANKGSHGIDGMKVDELLQHLKENGETLRQSLLMERYKPKPVRRVEIPKPNGGTRLLGIPTVVDRVIQQAILGWVNYFSIADMKSTLQKLDAWLRRRMRMCFWKQWKKISTKHNNLVRLGVSNYKAWEYANTRKSYWRISKSPILEKTLTKKYLEKLGLVSMTEIYLLKH